jgi:hypothetical protein
MFVFRLPRENLFGQFLDGLSHGRGGRIVKALDEFTKLRISQTAAVFFRGQQFDVRQVFDNDFRLIHISS